MTAMGTARIAVTKWCSQVTLHFTTIFLSEIPGVITDIKQGLPVMFINAHLIVDKVW